MVNYINDDIDITSSDENDEFYSESDSDSNNYRFLFSFFFLYNFFDVFYFFPLLLLKGFYIYLSYFF